MIDVIDLESLRKFLNENEWVVACFTEPATCAPCRALAPHFAAADELSEMFFVKVDLGKAKDELIDEYEIRSVPQILLFHNGILITEITERTGPKILRQLKGHIE